MKKWLLEDQERRQRQAVDAEVSFIKDTQRSARLAGEKLPKAQRAELRERLAIAKQRRQVLIRHAN